MVTEDDVRHAALSLPGAYEKVSYGGSPSWRTKPRMFAWMLDEEDALVVWVESGEEKEALLASDPDTFFTTNHYEGHPVVLVRMAAIDVDELVELIGESWRHRAPRSLTSSSIHNQGSGAS
ncbi:MAG: MmcQ/YjbR family DNA-binding protein [Ornithinimicrobium sp.]